MERMAELLAEKGRLESCITGLEARLGVISSDDGRLVDEDGFPVADLPIIEIRQLRHDLACTSTGIASMRTNDGCRLA